MYCERDPTRSVPPLIKGGTAANRSMQPTTAQFTGRRTTPLIELALAARMLGDSIRLNVLYARPAVPSRRQKSPPTIATRLDRDPARVRCPIPFEIDRPRRDVREHHDRCRGDCARHCVE